MHKTIPLLSAALLISLCCGREKLHTPPADAEIISFAENKNVQQQVIYQSDYVRTFARGESLHRYWAGINRKPSHRLHLRLLSSSSDILFTVFFPSQNRKVFSKIMDSKEITGCEIPEQVLTDDEFIVEVFAPKGEVFKKDPEYRLFIGIQGYQPLKFYQHKNDKVK